ncbi:MAG: altronate dehydratase family protein [Rhodospirillales bacterium]|jgi:altronate hydrolase|nr:altronate dehydratase family protein [Rhodospirillales bacterium]
MTARKSPIIRLAPTDNVVVAREALAAGSVLEGEGVTLVQTVPAGHKVATAALAKGEPVRKYGQIIGFATADIAPGQHVHLHNLGMGSFDRDYAFGADCRDPAMVAEAERATFEGYVRADGRVGTRNYIAVISTVNCSATVTNRIADAFRGDALSAFPHVDGVFPVTHGGGCGRGVDTEDVHILQRCTIGYATNPNVAGFLLVGLGCESNLVDGIVDRYGLADATMSRFINIQDAGGSAETIRQGVAMIREMLPEADKARRRTVSASHLMLGLQCGGSDGYSGITANPALGAAADLLVRHGGTAVLGETPEVYGAEHLLTRRAVSRAVGEKLVERIHWWEEYTAKRGGEMDNNPSPGNKEGGLTTILEKSLGAVSKGGTTTMVDVVEYAEPVKARGFVFMDTPGYDPHSVTGIVAGGATINCFTTGRGSGWGCKPSPVIKLATNTPMFTRLAGDMDINCGTIADGEATVAEMGERIFKEILAVASGKPTKSEELGLGDSEFSPWQYGPGM